MANFFGSQSESSIVGAEPRVAIQPLMRQVYLWMTTGLLVTTAAAVTTNTIPALQALAFNPIILIGAIIGELVLVVALSAGLRRMSPGMAIGLFFLYAAVNGFVLSFIFIAYDVGSITLAFFSATALFAIMSVVGYTTNVDLTKYQSYFMIGLIGIIVASVINIFLRSSGFDFLISIFGVLLFTGLTAFHTQKIARLASDPEITADGSLMMKLSIMGALMLYLDFINLFLFLLRLFGGRDR
jgi:FtsH-binding integral membrane protein